MGSRRETKVSSRICRHGSFRTVLAGAGRTGSWSVEAGTLERGRTECWRTLVALAPVDVWRGFGRSSLMGIRLPYWIWLYLITIVTAFVSQGENNVS